MLIRREREGDIAAIDAVHGAAFKSGVAGAEPGEAVLVRALRDDASWVPELSLVAERAGEVVGHVVCSLGSVGEQTVLGLGPIGVLPTLQGHGIGNALMHAVVGAADALDHLAIVLLGNPKFYSRFGFVMADSRGISPTKTKWVPHLQVRPLNAWKPNVKGMFYFAGPFSIVE